MPSSTSSDTIDVPLSISAAGSEAVNMFVRLRSDGLSERWCEMVVLQQPPGTSGTDRAFMQGRYNMQQLDGMPADHARNILTLAQRAGINTAGKFYSSGLADGRGPADPGAWVDSLGDVKRVAQARNLTVSGAVEVKGTAVAPKRQALSERLTRELMARERKHNPRMKKGELREMVVAKYGRAKK